MSNQSTESTQQPAQSFQGQRKASARIENMMINNATSLGWNQVCDGQGGFNRYIQLGHYVNCNDEILRDTSIKTSLCGIMQKYQVENFEVDEVSSATYFSYQLTLPEKDYHELFDAMQKYEDEFTDITGSF